MIKIEYNTLQTMQKIKPVSGTWSFFSAIFWC